MKRLFAILLLSTTAILFAQERTTPHKFALVIGNSTYTNLSKLANPVNDATDVANVLGSLGFAVDIIKNGSLEEMEKAVLRLRENLRESEKAYGFFFFAGHGVQSGGENFLIPVDANIPSDAFLRNKSLSVQAVLDELNEAGNGLNVVVLDACRDNPFGWSRAVSSRGLATITRQPADSIIVYATSAGQIASDGTGRNGMFTSQLLPNLATPGLDVNEIFKRTGADVAAASNRQQIPAIYNQFFGTAFLGVPGEVAQRPAAVPYTPPVTRKQTAKDAWKNKWVYFGIGLGAGNSAWNKTTRFTTTDFPYYYDHNEDKNTALLAPIFFADISLLRFFSIELGIGPGFGFDKSLLVPLVPMLARFGYKFSKTEISIDAGYTIGAGFSLGGTFGLNLGAGIIFVKFLAVPWASAFEAKDKYILASGLAGFLGYKVGIISRVRGF